MKTNISLSVIIPAFNEAGNIMDAVNGLDELLKKYVRDYELIVINDGSSDTTAWLVKKLAAKNKKIRFIDRQTNLGFGLTVREGINAASKKYITQFHGDNDASPESIIQLINNIGNSDLIITYPTHKGNRSNFRRILSDMFVLCMNILFKMNLRYYNGTFICKTDLLKGVDLTSTGFAIYAEAKVRLIRSGKTYIEIPFVHTGRKSGHSKAISVKSFIQTCQTITNLIMKN